MAPDLSLLFSLHHPLGATIDSENFWFLQIWSFKMKSACCQHEIEIHTDPKNCDYVVVRIW